MGMAWIAPFGRICGRIKELPTLLLYHGAVIWRGFWCTAARNFVCMAGGFYEFHLRGVLRWLLMLPMAMPAYVLAFALLGVFDYSGGVQTYLRTHGVNASAWLDLRSDWGVVLVLSLALYPYIICWHQRVSRIWACACRSASRWVCRRGSRFGAWCCRYAAVWWMGGLGLAFDGDAGVWYGVYFGF